MVKANEIIGSMTPVKVILQDDDRDDVLTINAYECASRVRQSELPHGWHKFSLRCNDDSMSNDTIEESVTVNHLCDYVTREDIHSILRPYDGVMYCGGIEFVPQFESNGDH